MNFLCLRGLGRERRHWGEFESMMKESFPQAQLEFLDLPGAGTENWKEFPLSMEDAVEDVRIRWKKEKEGEWCLVGQSLGGMVGMAWCKKHPEDFQRLVLVNSSVSGISSLFERIQPQALFDLSKTLFLKKESEKEKVILSVVSNQKRRDPETLEHWVEIAKSRPMSTFSILQQLYCASRFRIPSRLEQMILVLSSDQDRMVSPTCSKKIALHFEAKLKTHPFAGHDLPLDDPKWMVDEIKNWISESEVESSTKLQEKA